MNPDEMTPEQVNVAIEEALGHKWTLYNGRAALFPPSLWERDASICVINPSDYPQLERVAIGVKDYHGSLDAMAQAEETLTEDELDKYVRELVFLMKTGEERIFMSKASRRARAFLQVKGGTA